MLSFVVEYDKLTGDSKITSYADIAEANRERFRLAEMRDSDRFEIATILGKSLEAIQKTHLRYFESERLAAA